MPKSHSPAKTSSAVRLLYLPRGIIPDRIQQMIPCQQKMKDLQSHEHPLLLETLQSMEDTEPNLFNLDTVFPCVLAYLYLDQLNREYDSSLDKQVKTLLGKVLQKEPRNLVALCIQAKLTPKKKQDASHTDLAKSEALAVVGYYLYKLNVIPAAIELLEQAVSACETEASDGDRKVAVWKYLLAAVYGQLFNRDHFTKRQKFDPDAKMHRVKELLESVIQFGRSEGETFLAARCYADLAMVFSKYELIGVAKERNVQIDPPTVLKCYKKAQEICHGKDPHVMEKYGTFLRKAARNVESLQEAVKILEELVERCPHRHVSAHQLSLAHKGLWWFAGKLDQRFLYQNNVRNGKVAKGNEQSKTARKRERRKENAKFRQLVANLDQDANEATSEQGDQSLELPDTVNPSIYRRQQEDCSSIKPTDAEHNCKDLGETPMDTNGAERVPRLSTNAMTEKQLLEDREQGEMQTGTHSTIDKSELGDEGQGERPTDMDVETEESISTDPTERMEINQDTTQEATGPDCGCNQESTQEATGADRGCNQDSAQEVTGPDRGCNQDSAQEATGADRGCNQDSAQEATGPDRSCNESPEDLVNRTHTSESFKPSPQLQPRSQSNRKWQKVNPIRPNWSTEHDKVPVHWNKKPDYYHRLRTENPIAILKNKRAKHHFQQAKKNLEKANESSKKSRVLYLVDLARLHISSGENGTARHYFKNAENALNRAVNTGRSFDHDTAYLYEQWALMLANRSEASDSESEMSDDDTDVDPKSRNRKLDIIEEYFLKSIKHATQIKSKSRVAYYKLAEMLQHSDEKWPLLYEIYKLVGQDEKASALLETKDVKEPHVRKLVKQECIDKAQFDKYLDLGYTIHASHQEGSEEKAELRKDIVDMTVLKWQKVSEVESQMQTKKKDYGEVLKICLRPHRAATRGKDNQPKEKRPKTEDSEDPVQVMMACYDESEVFAGVNESLNSCDIKVVKYCQNSILDDFPPGCNVETEIRKEMTKTHLLLVSFYVDVSEPEQFPYKRLEEIVKYAQHECNVPVCVVQENQDTSVSPQMGLPCLEFRTMHSFMEQLLRQLTKH